MLLQTAINTVFQIIVFFFIPVIWWLFTKRKKENFFVWVGLKRPRCSDKTKGFIISLLTFILLLLPGMYLVFSFENKALLANAKFAGLGINGVIPVLLYSVIQTGLCEEVFFRGFLNKRISQKFGFGVGNITQSVLFGLLHSVTLVGNIDMMFVIITVIFTFIVGLLMGYLNEKIFNGSIALSWAIHSLVNIVSSSMFLLGLISI
ncbi:MAG: CPBP family intramembrane metalloprotease [Clostridiales bacterium]|jgi:membrane protease YdiL (CAAX protease family)|nr:CPBP family intramembrane metalloprotease [Clostridiales bacterium]